MKLNKFSKTYNQYFKERKHYNGAKFRTPKTSPVYKLDKECTKVTKQLLKAFDVITPEYNFSIKNGPKTLNPRSNIQYVVLQFNLHNMNHVLTINSSHTYNFQKCNININKEINSTTHKDLYCTNDGFFSNYMCDNFNDVNFINPTEEQIFQYNTYMNFDMMKDIFDIHKEIHQLVLEKNISVLKIIQIITKYKEKL